MDEYGYIVMDTDAPMEDAIAMISNNSPNIILSPINTSQRDTALEHLPDFLGVLYQICGSDYSPMVRVVLLGVGQNLVSLRIEQSLDKPENCKAAPAMRNLQARMSKAKKQRKYIWNYSGYEELLDYFSSIIEIDI